MFTHRNASVWADLTPILWTAGLRVTAARTIATETESALKEGNYVQGTVLMVLRKQTSEDSVFPDEVVPEVEIEVERQLDSMLRLDDRDNPNFSDADYQRAVETGDVAGSLTWLRTEVPDYWPQREALATVLRYLSAIEIDHWREDADAALLAAGAVENDHV